MNKYQDIADKYTGQDCELYTLDGVKKALIAGRLCPYATIRAVDGSASIETTWPLVERKMESDKLFYAC